MAAPVGSLIVRVGAETSNLTRGFRRASGVVKGFGDVAARAAKRISLISTASAAVAAALAAKLTRDGLKSIDAMAKLGRTVGATQAEMVALNATADLVGISQEKMQKNVQAFTKRLGEALDGTGEAVGALDKLGLSAQMLANMPLPEALALVAERTQTLGTAAERAAVESDLFSRAGIGMLTTTGDLAGALRDATKDTQDFGIAVSQIDAAQVEAANDAMTRIGSVIRGVSNQLAVSLAPFLQEVAERITDAARESGGFRKEIEEAITSGIRIAGFFADQWRRIEIGIKAATLAALEFRDFFSTNLVDEVSKRLNENLPEGFKRTATEAGGAATHTEAFAMQLAQLVDAPLPSERIEEFLRNVRTAAAEAAAEVSAITSGEDVGDPLGRIGEEDPELAALSERIQRRLELIREGLTIEEALEREHQERMAALSEKAAAEQIRIEQQKRQAAIDTAFGAAHAVASIVENAARDNFAVQKAAAIASTVISAIESAVHSYRWGAQIGGPPLGAAMAAVAAAAQLARLASIRSADFRGGGSAASAGVSAGAGAAAAVPAVQGAAGGGGAGTTQTVNIALQGEIFNGEQVRNLIGRINEAVADGARIRVV